MVLHILLLLILPYLLLFLIISTFKVADLHGVFVGGYGTKGSYSSYTGSAIGTPQTDTLAIVIQFHRLMQIISMVIIVGHMVKQQVQKAFETSGNYATLPTSTSSTGSTETRPFNYSVTYFIKWSKFNWFIFLKSSYPLIG
jgi:uncharacterized membrane protein YadS